MTEEELNRKVDEIIGKMTVKEKIALCSGKDFWHTKDYPQYGIPSILMCDGPNGLRIEQGALQGSSSTGSGSAPSGVTGSRDSAPATCYPTAVTAAQTWNRRLLYEEGRAIGEEAKEAQAAVVLGPGVNIKRNPLCGRNFEYYSEDPYEAGEMGAAFVAGMQTETGIGTSVKHYACNSQEYCRLQSDSQIDERALREIYLRPFEKVVKKAQPASVMCAYNKINGTYCSDNRRLLTDILRGEWGFKGMVVTDWGALNDRSAAFTAGCDLAMPGGSSFGEKQALKDLKSGRISAEALDASVRRVLALILRRSEAVEKAKGYSYDRNAHDSVAQRLAEEGAVLLKNNDAVLPVPDPAELVLIGKMASNMRYQGGGSSHINPTKLVQVRDCLPGAAYVEGCDDEGNVTDESLLEITRAAARAKKAVVFVGLTDQYESEGFDRTNLSIPEGHNRMVKAALSGNPNVIVVVMGGSPMKLPWFDDVKAVLYTGLCGQMGGLAIANLLTGKVNPSGKLTETWPLEEIDIPSYGFYALNAETGECRRDAQYREGIYVGYRYYEKAGQKVRFPFGYGLSYTTFEYSNLLISDRNVTVQVKNTGPVAGAEVVQLYVGNPQDGPYRALKELRAFQKVFLQPGEGAMLTFQLASRDFALWQDGWKIPTGTYQIMVGSSSADIRLVQEVSVEEEVVPAPLWQPGSWYEHPTGQPTLGEWKKIMNGTLPESVPAVPGHFDFNSSAADMSPYSWVNRKLYNGIRRHCLKEAGGNVSDPSFRMAMSGSAEAPVRTLKIYAPKVPWGFFRFIVWRGNRSRK